MEKMQSFTETSQSRDTEKENIPTFEASSLYFPPDFGTAKEAVEKNDIPGEAFLNPDGMPELPKSDKEKQEQILSAEFEYKQMVANVLMEKVLKPNMDPEEIKVLADKEVGNEFIFNRIVREVTNARADIEESREYQEDLFPEGDTEAQEVLSLERTGEAAEEYLEKQRSAITHAVEATEKWLLSDNSLAKKIRMILLPGILATQLSGCLYNNIAQTVVYGAGNVAQAGMYGQQRAVRNEMYGQTQAGSQVRMAISRAQMSRDMRLMDIENTRQQSIGNGLSPEQAERDARMQAAEAQRDYVQALQMAKMNYEEQMMMTRQNTEQIQMNTRVQVMDTEISVITNILNQALQGVMSGGHGSGGYVRYGR